MAKRVNCRAAYQFQVDAQTPGPDGRLGDPGAATLSGLVMRLSATEGGAGIHAAVTDLPCTELAAQADPAARRFKCLVSATLLTTYVLPLGEGAAFYAVFSKSGELEGRSIRFTVADGEGS